MRDPVLDRVEGKQFVDQLLGVPRSPGCERGNRPEREGREKGLRILRLPPACEARLGVGHCAGDIVTRQTNAPAYLERPARERMRWSGLLEGLLDQRARIVPASLPVRDVDPLEPKPADGWTRDHPCPLGEIHS